MSRRLIVGDIHLPAVRKGYLEFCQDIASKWKCDKITFIGDIIDWHAISRHVKEPECPGSQDEYALVKELIKPWYKAFPNAEVCEGNHDLRPYRMAKIVNIPRTLMKTQNELWGTPKWVWADRFEHEGVIYVHGIGYEGIHPAWQAVQAEHSNIVLGHRHARAEIVWTASHKMRLFGMSVGCGIDQEAYQFAYGTVLKERPFLSVGLLIDGVPFIIPMPCGQGEKYHDHRF